MIGCKWSSMVREALSVVCQILLTSTFRWQASKSCGTGNQIGTQQVANDIDEIKCSWIPNLPLLRSSCLNFLTGNQLIQLLRSWLSPADPSTNHNIAQKAQHIGTAAWLFQGQIIIKWKSTGSLLWIHGKRTFLLLFPHATSDKL